MSVGTDDSSPVTLRLADELTLRTVTEAHQKLLSAYAESKRLVIDTSRVIEADLAAVQLIESVRRAAIADGKLVSLSPPPPPAISTVLERGGFLNTSEGHSFWKGAP